MTEIERAALIGQLLAMRNVLDGVLATLQEEDPTTGCLHPIEKRKYSGETMGAAAEFTCQQCGAVVFPTEGG